MACLFAGLVLGAASFWFVTQTLKKQLHEQLIMLHELLGEDVEGHSGQTVETLLDTVNNSVSRVRDLLTNLYPTVDEFVPHCQTRADARRYLSARAEDGLQAAKSARTDVDGMHQKQ